ncbi:MAG: hypothetical protein RL093_1628, partial [Pseudomonadota bacterium]
RLNRSSRQSRNRSDALGAGWFITKDTKDHEGHEGRGDRHRSLCALHGFFFVVFVKNQPAVRPEKEARLSPGWSGRYEFRMHTASFAGVRDAARQIAGHAVRTPLIESPALNALTGGRILLKAENLQRAGAFKFRGAWNRISRLTDEEKARGVVAYSSGNHAQAVAAAAQILGVEAIIVMPADSPRVKV